MPPFFVTMPEWGGQVGEDDLDFPGTEIPEKSF